MWHRTVQLVATAALSAVSFWSDSYREWIQTNQWMMWGSVRITHEHLCFTY